MPTRLFGLALRLPRMQAIEQYLYLSFAFGYTVFDVPHVSQLYVTVCRVLGLPRFAWAGAAQAPCPCDDVWLNCVSPSICVFYFIYS